MATFASLFVFLPFFVLLYFLEFITNTMLNFCAFCTKNVFFITLPQKEHVTSFLGV